MTDTVSETEVIFEVWQNGDMVAAADSLADAEHFMLVYGQDGPVEAKTAITTRFPGFNVVTAMLAASPQGEGGPPTRGGVVGDLDLYDDKVQAGISWTMRQWGEALGLTTWTQGDGSESVEGDVGAEIHTILIDAGLRDPETNEMVRVKALAQKIDILRRADTEGVKP